MQKAGFEGEIIGITPYLQYVAKCGCSDSVPRGCEIDAWITNNIDWNSRKHLKYAILDDDSDMMYHQRESFFLIDGYCGLTYNVAENIITHLNRFDESVNSDL